MRISKITLAAIATTSAALTMAVTGSMAQAPASGPVELRACEDSNIGLRDLAISASGNGVRSFYEGAALVLLVDTIEPAAASAGVVVLLLDPQSEMGDRNCFAATGLSGLDLDTARSSYSPATGVTLSIPAMTYDHEEGYSKPGKPLILTIDAATGSVTARR